MKKILLITDGQGWIVDRITNVYVEKISHNFTICNRNNLSAESLLEISEEFDIIHYNNWGMFKYKNVIPQIKTPQVMSIRSFRFGGHESMLREVLNYMDIIHVLDQEQLNVFKEFSSKNVCIPDGIFIDPEIVEPFVVGMAFQDTEENKEYKGYNLVKQVCDDLGIELKIANDLKPEQMVDFYRSINLLICASENEGFSAPAMECLALNVPVATTRVGFPRLLNCHFIERNPESIKEMILRFNTSKQVLGPFSWDAICEKISTYIYGEL